MLFISPYKLFSSWKQLILCLDFSPICVLQILKLIWPFLIKWFSYMTKKLKKKKKKKWISWEQKQLLRKKNLFFIIFKGFSVEKVVSDLRVRFQVVRQLVRQLLHLGFYIWYQALVYLWQIVPALKYLKVPKY